MGPCTISSERNAFTCDPGRIIQVKITEFFSTSDWWLCMIKKLLEIIEHRTVSNWKLQRNFILITWWEIETSGRGTMLWNEDQLPGVNKREEAGGKKVGECFQWKAQGQCSKGDSCRFSHDKQASGNSGGGKGQRRKKTIVLSRTTQRQNRLTEKMATKREIFTREVSFSVDTKIVIIRRVSSGILPCVWTTSLKRLCLWRHMPFPTCWGRRKAQQEIEERLCKRMSCNHKWVYTIPLCISRFSPDKFFPSWTWKIGNKTRREISPKSLHQTHCRKKTVWCLGSALYQAFFGEWKDIREKMSEVSKNIGWANCCRCGQ